MTSINLLGLVFLVISIGLITYECQNNKYGYIAIVFAAIGGKWIINIIYLIRQMATSLTFFKYEIKGHKDK